MVYVFTTAWICIKTLSFDNSHFPTFFARFMWMDSESNEVTDAVFLDDPEWDGSRQSTILYPSSEDDVPPVIKKELYPLCVPDAIKDGVPDAIKDALRKARNRQSAKRARQNKNEQFKQMKVDIARMYQIIDEQRAKIRFFESFFPSMKFNQ